MVILSVLGTVHFFTPSSMPKRIPWSFVMPVQANGLCFWSCLFLATKATAQEKFFWHHRERNEQGFPAYKEIVEEEDQKVLDFALGLHGLPEGTRERILQRHSVIPEDIDPCFLILFFIQGYI